MGSRDLRSKTQIALCWLVVSCFSVTGVLNGTADGCAHLLLQSSPVTKFQAVLGGSWVVISRVTYKANPVHNQDSPCTLK